MPRRRGSARARFPARQIENPGCISVCGELVEETAQIAVQSALTGHLVFTTVHANNVVDVIGRFLNMNVDLYNFVAALNCVIEEATSSA